MGASNTPVPLETLLSHRPWVRRLARALVSDAATADDLEQQAWLAAMRRPPQRAETARAWLGRVVRNLAFDARRSRRRRDAHETRAARPETTASTAHVVAEAEAHARLVAAVHALPEPYLTTVLLRWFEDLAPAAVAARLDVPVETVRTRLRRAQQMLRARLDADGRGDASTWIAALSPLTGLRLETGSAVSSAPLAQSASLAKGAALGGTVMGTKLVVASGIAAAVAAAFFGGTLVSSERDAASLEESAAEIATLRSRLEKLEGALARRGSSGGERASAGLESRVAEQDSRIGDVEASLAAIREGAGRVEARGPTEGSAAPPKAADDPVKRLESLSNEALLDEIRALVTAQTRGEKFDGRALVQACDVLLARNTERAVRWEILMHKGVGHRSQISRTTPDERQRAETAFRDAVALAGAGTREARDAELQIAWTVEKAKDYLAAADLFLRLAADTGDTIGSRAMNRFRAGAAFDNGRDTSRAVAELRSLIDDLGTSAEAKEAVDQARAKLDFIATRDAPR